jgi:hypothetical protein
VLGLGSSGQNKSNTTTTHSFVDTLYFNDIIDDRKVALQLVPEGSDGVNYVFIGDTDVDYDDDDIYEHYLMHHKNETSGHV